MSTKWEYATVRIGDPEYGLNDAGESGWELVCFGPDGLAYMKRPKEQ
jgi:hypothetical protein